MHYGRTGCLDAAVGSLLVFLVRNASGVILVGGELSPVFLTGVMSGIARVSRLCLVLLGW